MDVLNLPSELITKVYQYCETTNFFVDFCHALLDGEEHLDASKTDVKYKSGLVRKLINLLLEPRVDSDTSPGPHANNLPIVIIEEKYNFANDIDRLKEIIKNRKKLKPHINQNNSTYFQRKNSKPVDVSSMYSEENLKYLSKYPSLLEKYEEIKFRREQEMIQQQFLLSQELKSGKQLESPSSNTRRLRESVRTIVNNKGRILNGIQRMNTQSNEEEPGMLIRKSATGLGNIIRSLSKTLVSEESASKGPELSLQKTMLMRTFTAFRSATNLMDNNNIIAANNNTEKLNAFTVDESMCRGALSVLGKLYPPMVSVYLESPVDQLSKKVNYMPKYVRDNDEYNLLMAETLHLMVQLAIENSAQETRLRSYLKISSQGHSPFWNIYLKDENSVCLVRTFQVMLLSILTKTNLFMLLS